MKQSERKITRSDLEGAAIITLLMLVFVLI
jgi:hypothetical protein